MGLLVWSQPAKQAPIATLDWNVLRWPSRVHRDLIIDEENSVPPGMPSKAHHYQGACP